MRSAWVSHADGLAGRMMMGFVDTSARHPLLTSGFLGLLLALVVLLWIEMLRAPRPEPLPLVESRPPVPDLARDGA